MDDRRAFLAQIEADPLSHLLRCVFADWLDERGESDEADRQRQWVGAFEYLRDRFVTPYLTGDWTEEHDTASPPTPADVMRVLGDWEAALAAEGGFHLGSADGVCEDLRTRDTLAEFCRNLEIVTGGVILPETRERAWFGCAC